MAKNITLDGEIVDRITILGLKEHRNYLRSALKLDKKGMKKLHPEDLAYNLDMVEHLTKVLSYYGEK